SPRSLAAWASRREVPNGRGSEPRKRRPAKHIRSTDAHWKERSKGQMKLRAITLLTVALVLAAACGGQGGTNTPSATGGTAAGAITGNITLWHAYGTGGSEETALNQLIDKIRTANPTAKITVLQVPFDQVFNKFQTEAAAGGGPDLFTAPNEIGRAHV